MKRQDSLPLSSSHREKNPTGDKLHAKAVGCMSGLFHFVSGSHRRRKFLTFGKRQEKNQVSSSTTEGRTKSSSPKIDQNCTAKLDEQGKTDSTINALQRCSCEVPRSPTLPAEIRRSNSVNSTENFRAPPALMARLMGLEEAPPATSNTVLPLEYSAADQKRRQLIGALEKCDRDLKALKKIIDAVRWAERLPSLPTTAFGSPQVGGRAGKMFRAVKDNLENHNNVNVEQPSPVSVLDDFMTRSPLSSYHSSKRHSYNNGRVQHHLRQQKKKPREEDFMISTSIFDRLTCESLQRKPALRTDILHYIKPVDLESNSAEFAAALSPPSPPSPPSPSPSPLWSSKALKETVEEVCKDIAWGEKREMRRIGLALQDLICRDLIEEIVNDLGPFQSYNTLNCYSLPFEACKRRLCF